MSVHWLSWLGSVMTFCGSFPLFAYIIRTYRRPARTGGRSYEDRLDTYFVGLRLSLSLWIGGLLLTWTFR